MIYGDLSTEWKWILTSVIVGSGLLLLWALYKSVLYKLSWDTPKAKALQDNIVHSYICEEEIVIPITGRLLPINEVPDPIFSEKMVGDGFAIEPVKEEICSPINGRITQIYSNQDAITLKTDSDRNVILHIGVDTSNLKGKGIEMEVSEGEQVHAGQRIGKLNLEYIIPRVPSSISPVVFPDLKEDERIALKRVGEVEAGMRDIVFIEKLER